MGPQVHWHKGSLQNKTKWTQNNEGSGAWRTNYTQLRAGTSFAKQLRRQWDEVKQKIHFIVQRPSSPALQGFELQDGSQNVALFEYCIYEKFFHFALLHISVAAQLYVCVGSSSAHHVLIFFPGWFVGTGVSEPSDKTWHVIYDQSI